jgi:SagB-type dehydrogenase family enzyme
MRKQIYVIIAILIISYYNSLLAQDTIFLAAPSKEGKMSLIEALQKRKSTRNFSTEKLSDQQLSDLLWSAFGINRPEEMKRTAPSSRNQQEIDIYVFTEDGVFIYDAANHAIIRIMNEDLRKYTGKQDFVENAAVNLVYIADHTKSKSDNPVGRSKTSHINTGFIGQNIYLYAASQGMGCVVRGYMDKEELAAKMNLKENQEIIVAQSVGVIDRGQRP